jgi:hypothetical protein
MIFEHELMIDLARSLNEVITPAREGPPPAANNGDQSGSPGTQFNAQGSWQEVLVPHGWQPLYENGGRQYWSRPGKVPPGPSATTGLRSECGKDLLYVFSTNASPLEPNRSYSKFAARTYLEFQGNFAACALALAREGYGTPATPTANLHFTGTISPLGNGEAPSTKKRVRTIEPYIPFPTEALPVPLREFVEHGSAALGCDAAYLALPVLAMIASCIGNARVIVLKPGWPEPSVLWSCVVGDSGTLKSPALHKVIKALYRWQKAVLRDYEPLREQWEQDIEVWNQRNQQNLKKIAAGGPVTLLGPKPVKPVLQRWLVNNTTVEKVALLLEENPRGLLLVRDELGGWIGSFQRYHQGSDLPYWLEAFRAEPWIRDRVGKTGDRTTIFIPHAAVSITGGITPGALRYVLSPEYLEHGFGARLLLAMPPRKEKRWSEACIPEDVENAYTDLLTRLLALDGDRDDQGDLIPAEVNLSPEAKAIWVPFYNDWAKETAAAEGDLVSAFSKLEGIAARFALLHHTVSEVMASRDGRAAIKPESVEAGVILTRWFGNEARRIYATLSETTEEGNIRRLVEWIQQRGGSATARDLQRSNAHKYPSSAAAEAVLEELVKGGFGELKQTSTTSAGGRPSQTFSLYPNPTSDKTDTTSPEELLPDEEASDITSDTTSENPQNPRVFEGSVGCRTSENSEQTAPEPGGGSVGRDGVLSDGDEVNEGEL